MAVTRDKIGNVVAILSCITAMQDVCKYMRNNLSHTCGSCHVFAVLMLLLRQL